MSVSANVTPLHRVYIEGEARAALPSSDRPGLSYPRVPDDKGVLARMTTWMVQEGIYPIKVIQSGGGVHDGLYVEQDAVRIKNWLREQPEVDLDEADS